VLTYGQIFYGVAVTVIGVAAVTLVAPRWRRLGRFLTAVVGTSVAVLAWQFVLHATHASQFFTDLPFGPFPVSWQDAGSGVVAFAGTALVLAYGTMRKQPASQAASLALAAGAVALLVDVYLY
jgi:hypothetical protein